jgi:hypothetical protein
MSNQMHGKPRAIAQRRSQRVFECTHLALALIACACSGDVLVVGENDDDESSAEGSVCQSATGEDSILVENQAQLDELAGCEAIDGDLTIRPFSSANLLALRSLRRVEGAFDLGLVNFIEIDPAKQGELQALVDAGWLESLEGLENLERVGSLSTSGILASSLRPMAGLRFIGGSLSMHQCPNLEDLSGLENIRSIKDLTIGWGQLRDISALHLAEKMDGLRLSGPVETLDVTGVRELGILSIDNTALSNLDAFAGLQMLGVLSLGNNPQLENTLGLNGLLRLDELYVWSNPRLSKLANFDAIIGYPNSLTISDNPMLMELPSFPGLDVPSQVASNWEYPPVEIFSVTANESLQRIAVPLAFRRMGALEIANNAQLSEVEFTGLRTVDKLDIRDNPALRQVGLGILSEVSWLRVVRNPLLPSTAFDGVRSFESTISWNAPSTP